jgi:transcriptional regulator with XRE-family HTH domain
MSEKKMRKALFGEFFQQKRRERKLTLREFCRKCGYDAGNISKIERGLFAPPASSEKLDEYALNLGLKQGSTDWIEFHDRASVCRGEIPAEILNDRQLVENLPLIFRTIKGKKVSAAMLKELAEEIRRL